ncbi:MAG: hypothetical protein LBK29_03995, partial [Oscillospiraceae bacterium]|nr:hypothetical protein [Oscillospiraceae bacterium]
MKNLLFKKFISVSIVISILFPVFNNCTAIDSPLKKIKIVFLGEEMGKVEPETDRKIMIWYKKSYNEFRQINQIKLRKGEIQNAKKLYTRISCKCS